MKLYNFYLDYQNPKKITEPELSNVVPNLISDLSANYISKYNTYIESDIDNGIIKIIGIEKNGITIYPRTLNVLKIEVNNENE